VRSTRPVKTGTGKGSRAAVLADTREVFEEERLKPKGMSQTALAEKMGLDVQVVNGIVQGRRAVTAKTALLLADALDTTPQYWTNLQNACDLWEAEREPVKRPACWPGP
jgi:antitoxin HigA-1